MSASRYGPPPGGELRGINRRSFLKLSGAGLAGAAILGTLGAGGALAQAGSPLEEEFEAAAKEYGVPVALLKAMGYVNTRWEMPPPDASSYEEGELHGWGGYGIMALVRNPTSDTLGEASKLSGIPVEELKADRAANIMGGAALLSRSQGTPKPNELGGWFGAVAGRGGNGKIYKAPAGVGGEEIYADQVFETLRRGASKRTKNGEQVALEAGEVRR